METSTVPPSIKSLKSSISSSPATVKKSVSFNSDSLLLVHNVEARSQISNIAKACIWYNRRELKGFVESALGDVRAMQQQSEPVGSLCVRGLECFESPETHEQRRMIKDSMTTAVLAEQERQRSESGGYVYDPQEIANAAAYCSVWSKNVARKLALEDEQHQRKQHLEDTNNGSAPAGATQHTNNRSESSKTDRKALHNINVSIDATTKARTPHQKLFARSGSIKNLSFGYAHQKPLISALRTELVSSSARAGQAPLTRVRSFRRNGSLPAAA